MRVLLTIPAILLLTCMAGFVSCAEDEVLLPSDSTYMGLLPDAPIVEENKAFSDYMANRYLNFGSHENRMLYLADSLGLMELDPVVVPEGEGFVPGSYNFGWPVAAMSGTTIIVSTQRKLLPGQPDDKSGKGQLLIISGDKGESWAAPVEVQTLQPYGYWVGSQSCIGVAGEKIIQKGSGTLITDNQGENWSPYPRAFKFASQEAYGINGPRIHLHPSFGLIFLTGNTPTIDRGSVFRSDDGTEWEDDFWNIEGGAGVVCRGPSALVLDDGSILMLASNGNRMVQYLYRYTSGDTYADIQFTADTIKGINTSRSAYDVPDLILNPVTGRIEMLESNPTNLLLWSINKNDLLGGSISWELESTLLSRDGFDSMHPAGSVVDTDNQVQHIFLYIGGAYPDRNCIFRLSRTLDTGSLSGWINNYRLTNGI